jgi:hypothetical protein
MTLSANTVKKKIEVKDEYIYITLTRGLGVEQERCRYQIKVESEGLVIDGLEDDEGLDELVDIDVIEHVFEAYECDECSDSEVPGRHYNNADVSSGQFVNCSTCNKDGDLSP